MSFYTNRTVLVTGADGFIGSHLTEALVAAGAQVRALVQYNSFDSWGWLDHTPADIRNAIEVTAGDVRDAACMENVIAGCDTVFHLAALIAIPYSYRAPESYVDTNIIGTLNVLQAARKAGVRRLVHTSTSEVYGSAQFVPITEAHPLVGQSPYSASKIGADQMAIAFHRSFALPVAIMRPFNTYGPRQSTRAVIPTIITQLANGAPALRLGALLPTRDLTFVADTAAGFLAVGEADAAVGEVINTGSGFEISIGDLARLLAEIAGRPNLPIEQEHDRLRPQASEVNRLFASIEKAEALCQWRPHFGGLAGLRAGLEKTFAWFSDPANLARYRSGRYTV
jgi:NAD dependent epimerase/dehydratase